MTELELLIDNAADLLDASAGLVGADDFDRRRRLLDAARAPRVAYMTRLRLIDEAVEDLTKGQ